MPVIVPSTTTTPIDYTTLAILKASLGITDTDDDLRLSAAITASSRALDRLCGTTFYPVYEARQFDPESVSEVWVDRFTDVGSLVVKTGSDGTFGTTVPDANIVLWPYNAPSRGDAYCRIICPTGAFPTRLQRPSVQVTAYWGYAEVPEEVAESCLLKAAKLYRRKDSPEGVAGSSEFGIVRISKFEDPDILQLMAPYMPARFG